MAEAMFDGRYIDAELGKIGARVKAQLTIYLIGGCAMSFRGLKESTKDVDIVFKNNGDYKLFCDALFGAEYYEPIQVKSEHEKLEAVKMYENKDGFHLDLFIEKVMGKLHLSENMVKRAEFYKKYGNLEVRLISKGDIFLFKGLASEGRRRDLPDMEILYPGLDWEIIENELRSQKLSEELIGTFVRRLKEFNKIYRLDVPLLDKLKRK